MLGFYLAKWQFLLGKYGKLYGKMNEHYMMINHAQFEALCIVLPWKMLSLPRDMLYINVVLPGKGGSSGKNMVLLKASNSYWENEQMCIYIYYVCQDNWWVLLVWPKTYYIENVFVRGHMAKQNVVYFASRNLCFYLKKTHRHKPSWNLCQCSFTFQWLTVWAKEIVVSCRMRWFLFPSSPSNKCILPSGNLT